MGNQDGAFILRGLLYDVYGPNSLVVNQNYKKEMVEMNIRTRQRIYLLAFIVAFVILISAKVYASESVSAGLMTLPTNDREIVSVILPTEGTESPIDFFIDPQGLIFETDAAKYGGGTVEEGANILFHNHRSDEYDFSSKSDSFKITNQSTVPVDVTITAGIDNLGSIMMADSRDFPEEQAVIYLALLDDDGNEVPLSADEDVSVTVNMRAASMEAYAYVYDEDAGDYRYGYLVNPRDDYFDIYSFGLVGDCNEGDVWAEISESPKVTVTWKVEPVRSDDEGAAEEEEQETEVQEDVTGEDIQTETLSENELSVELVSSESDEQRKDDGDQAQKSEGESTENAGVGTTDKDNASKEGENQSGVDTHAESVEIVVESKGTADFTGTEGVEENGGSSLKPDSGYEDTAFD